MDNPKSGWLWLAGIAMSAALVPASTEAASFDCSKAAEAHEVAICSNSGLSRQDEVLATLYKQALALTDDKEGLREQQRGWIERTRACGPDIQCLSGNYDIRYEELFEITNSTESVVVPPEEPAVAADEPVLPVESQADPVPAETVSNADVAPAANDGAVGGQQGEPLPAGNQALVAAGLIGFALVLILLLLGVKRLAEASAERYGWNLVLNWWNLTYPAAIVLALILIFASLPVAAGVVLLAAWLFMLALNIRKTSFLMGTAISLVQPFIVIVLAVFVQLLRGRRAGQI